VIAAILAATDAGEAEVDGEVIPSLAVDTLAVVAVSDVPCAASEPEPPPHAVNKTAAHAQDSAVNEN
jgi:hypothetical protein